MLNSNNIVFADEKEKMDTYYTVIGHLEALPGKELELKDMLMSLVNSTLKEEGCVNYILYQSRENPRKFMFYENWTDLEAFKQHGKTPHIKAWEARKHELLSSPNAVTSWQMIK